MDQEIDPYELTLNTMKSAQIKEWSELVLNQLREFTDLENDHFTFLAGMKYRKFLVPQMNHVNVPLEGLGIGKQLQKLKKMTSGNAVTSPCAKIHEIGRNLERFRFPYDDTNIPKNGLYLLFEKGESGHHGDRIVRIGTHTGANQLKSRIKQHFLNENKDRSIFRKNIGRSLLNRRNDPFLEFWELDLTARKAKDQYSDQIDFEYQAKVEEEVSEYMRTNLSFSVIEIPEKSGRLEIESKIISTVSWCEECGGSGDWLGQYSPKDKIVKSGLWLVNELYKTPYYSQNEIQLILNKKS